MLLPTGSANPVVFHLRLLGDIVKVMILSLPSLFWAIYYTFAARPQKDVKGEIVMVTGAGQGIGRQLCLAFSKLGSELVCVDILPEINLETVQMIREAGGTARGYVCDVADRKAIMKLEEQVGRVDILINNAGVYPLKGLWNATEADLRTIMDINVMSQFWTVQAFMPGMKSRDHGHVVSVSSVAGLTGLGYLEPYAVSKAGLTALMQTLHQELRKEGRQNIKLSTIYPYFVKTRSEITECCDTRIPHLTVEEATESIVKGILEEEISFTVPKSISTILNLNRFTTQTYQDMWFDTFYVRISEPKEDRFKEFMDTGILNSNSGTIQLQG